MDSLFPRSNMKRKIFFLVAALVMSANFSFAQDVQELFKQGTQAIKAGNYEVAFKTLQEAHRLDSDNVGVACNLAIMYAYFNDPEKGASILSSVIDKEPLPQRGILYFNLGSLYNHSLQGNNEKAIEAYERALEAMVHFGQACLAASVLYMDDNRKKADKYIARTLSLDSFITDLPVLDKNDSRDMGATTIYARSYDKSEPHFSPYFLYHSASWFINLAINYMTGERYQEAFEAIDKAEKALDPVSELTSDKNAFTEIYLHRGNIYALQKNYDVAMEQYRKVYGIDPLHKGALLLIATTYIMKDDLISAKEYCMKALSVDPNFPAALKVKAVLDDIERKHGDLFEPKR